MNPRIAATSMMLAAAMMGMTYGKRADRVRPYPPTTTREKQAKNRYRRRKGKA